MVSRGPFNTGDFLCKFRRDKPVRKQLPTIFLRNNVWGTSSEIPYWWRITTQIWVVLLIGWKFASTNEKHYPDLGSAYDISMEFLRSFLRRHFVGKPVVTSRNVGCSVSGHGVISCRHIFWNRRFQTDGSQAFVLATERERPLTTARKSNNWLDQWQSYRLGTESGV